MKDNGLRLDDQPLGSLERQLRDWSKAADQPMSAREW